MNTNYQGNLICFSSISPFGNSMPAFANNKGQEGQEGELRVRVRVRGRCVITHNEAFPNHGSSRLALHLFTVAPVPRLTQLVHGLVCVCATWPSPCYLAFPLPPTLPPPLPKYKLYHQNNLDVYQCFPLEREIKMLTMDLLLS